MLPIQLSGKMMKHNASLPSGLDVLVTFAPRLLQDQKYAG